MNFPIASLSCVDGKDSSLPRLLDLFPDRHEKKAYRPLQVLKGIVRLVRHAKASSRI
jgi:hypothetical protein